MDFINIEVLNGFIDEYLESKFKLPNGLIHKGISLFQAVLGYVPHSVHQDSCVKIKRSFKAEEDADYWISLILDLGEQAFNYQKNIFQVNNSQNKSEFSYNLYGIKSYILYCIKNSDTADAKKIREKITQRLATLKVEKEAAMNDYLKGFDKYVNPSEELEKSKLEQDKIIRNMAYLGDLEPLKKSQRLSEIFLNHIITLPDLKSPVAKKFSPAIPEVIQESYAEFYLTFHVNHDKTKGSAITQFENRFSKNNNVVDLKMEEKQMDESNKHNDQNHLSVKKISNKK